MNENAAIFLLILLGGLGAFLASAEYLLRKRSEKTLAIARALQEQIEDNIRSVEGLHQSNTLITTANMHLTISQGTPDEARDFVSLVAALASNCPSEFKSDKISVRADPASLVEEAGLVVDKLTERMKELRDTTHAKRHELAVMKREADITESKAILLFMVVQLATMFAVIVAALKP